MTQKTALSILIFAFMVGCTNRGDRPTPELNHAQVEVFYATDRSPDDTSDVKTHFGPHRGKLSYGTTTVSIPRDHKMGELESPSMWRFEFRENPDKHVVLLQISPLSKAAYFDSIAARFHESDEKNAFIYIHGYNVTFEDAARRTAQMAYDLGFDGIPAFYSWPSHGSTPKYTFDEVNIQWAKSNVQQFLTEFLAESDADQVFLIAHSMGSRALTQAYLDAVNANPAISSKVKEIILAAPDIDADIFKRDIAPALVGAGRPVTLYASSEDMALQASKAVHGGHPRAGDSGDHIVIISGIETIDATEVQTSFLGHSYYADERAVISDMFYLINQGLRAHQRSGLKAVDHADGQYWMFRK